MVHLAVRLCVVPAFEQSQPKAGLACGAGGSAGARHALAVSHQSGQNIPRHRQPLGAACDNGLRIKNTV